STRSLLKLKPPNRWSKFPAPGPVSFKSSTLKWATPSTLAMISLPSTSLRPATTKKHHKRHWLAPDPRLIHRDDDAAEADPRLQPRSRHRLNENRSQNLNLLPSRSRAICLPKCWPNRRFAN